MEPRESLQFTLLPFQPIPKGLATIQERFEAFHQANPQVYTNLKKLAIFARERGVRKIGVKALIERLRWEYNLKTDHGDYRLNNSFTSRYARMLAQDPRLAGMIETRRMKQEV